MIVENISKNKSVSVFCFGKGVGVDPENKIIMNSPKKSGVENIKISLEGKCFWEGSIPYSPKCILVINPDDMSVGIEINSNGKPKIINIGDFSLRKSSSDSQKYKQYFLIVTLVSIGILIFWFFVKNFDKRKKQNRK